MARTGGPANLSGVDYQVLYTATRFAEAVLSDTILFLRPESHTSDKGIPLPTVGQAVVTGMSKPAVDDLVIMHRDQPTEYISLKYRDGDGNWDVAQLKSRDILPAFYKQWQASPTAELKLVSQTSFDRALEDCIERVRYATPETLATELDTQAVQAAFKTISDYLASEFKASTSDALLMLRQVKLIVAPAHLLTENLMLRLQPHVEDVDKVEQVLTAFALKCGAAQTRLTPEMIRQELIRVGLPLIIPPARAAIIAQFELVSSSLTNEPATIGQAVAHHITRPETDQLIKWIQAPLDPDQASHPRASRVSRVIIGGAGTGKTVLLRDICLKLQSLNVPVIGLKADRLHGRTKGELLHEIEVAGLEVPLRQALATVATEDVPAVIIIDQLDALSLCLSAERGPLKSYTALLADLQAMPHVRLIVSCRTFDLSHDPDFEFLRSTPRVTVPLLNDDQVKQALIQTGTEHNAVDSVPALRELLRVPLHLSLYCALDEEARRGQPITTLQELYKRLVDQYLTRRDRLPTGVEAKRVKDLLYGLAVDMNAAQVLQLPEFKYFERDEDALAYVCSRGVVARTNAQPHQLVFFHQSFFEYLFARHFTHSGQFLADFVLNSGQGLFQRSLIQQVMVYLRGADSAAYSQALTDLLSSPSCRFHLKLLLVQQVASQQQPTTAEQDITYQVILPQEPLRLAFVEAARTRAWLGWLCAAPVFQELLPKLPALEFGPGSNHLANSLFWNAAKNAPDVALERASTLPDTEHSGDWVRKIISDLHEYDSPLFTQLFDKYFTTPVPASQQFAFWYTLKEVASALPEWTARKTVEALAEWPKDAAAQHEEHMQAEIWKDIFKADALVGFEAGTELLRRWVRNANYYRVADFNTSSTKYLLLPPPDFMDVDPGENEAPHTAPHAIYHYVQTYLTSTDAWPTSQHRRLIKKWLNSRTKLFVQLALMAIERRPTEFIQEVAGVFTKPGWLGEVARRRHLGHISLNLLPVVWDNSAPVQQAALATAIISHPTLIEQAVWQDRNGKKRYDVAFGHAAARYLQALTWARVANNPALAALFKQLERRWKAIPNDKPGPRIRVTHGHPSPVTQWNTDRMTKNHWLTALRKYRTKPNDFFSREKGTYEGLCQYLESLIKAAPAHYIPLLEHLIDQNEVSIAKVLPALNDADAALAAPLIEAAYARGLLTGDVVRTLRRHARRVLAVEGSTAEPAFVDDAVATIFINLNGESNTSSGMNLLNNAINSAGGRMLYDLLGERHSASTLPQVLEILDKVASNGNVLLRAAAVHHLAMLMNAGVSGHDVTKRFNELVGSNYELLFPGLWSLQYLLWHDYDTVLDLLRRGLATPEAHKSIAKLLIVAWANNKPGARPLLDELWKLDPMQMATSLKMLTDVYEEWDDKTAFYEGFELFLESPLTNELQEAYNRVFLFLPPEAFQQILPLLFKYLEVCAPAFKNEQQLLNYLAKCVRNHPISCIAVLRTFFDKLPAHQHFWPAKQAVELFIEAYTALRQQGTNQPGLEEALDLFDHLLTRQDCRGDLEQVLVEAQNA